MSGRRGSYGHRGGGSGRRGGAGGDFKVVVTASAPPSVSSTLTPSAASPKSTAPVTELQRLSLQPPTAPKHLAAPPASSKAITHPTRPGYGIVGTKCVVRANHLLVELIDRDLHHYDVSVTPEVVSRGVNRAILRELMAVNLSDFNGRTPAYDGRKGLYAAGPLAFTSKEFVVRLINRDERDLKESEFKVAIKLASKTDMSHLKEFLNSKVRDVPHETIQVLDAVLRESPSEKCTVVERSFFAADFGGKNDIGNGVECWKGFYQSLRPTQMGMSLNIATAFYHPISVLVFVVKFLNLGDPSRAAPRPLSDSDLIKLKKVLRGVKVRVTHGEGKCYKISSVTTVPTNQLLFTTEGKLKMSVVQYFYEKYKMKLRFASWPALQSGNESKPIFLPMECCMIVEGQRYTKKLSEKQVTAMLKEACKRPTERERSIEEIAHINDYKNDELAKEFGIDVDNKLTYIDARVLPPPVLKYHDSGKERTIRPRVGQWNMINAKMFSGATVSFWACVNFSSLNEQMASRFCQELVGMCRNKGMAMNPTPVFPTWSRHPKQIEKTLVEAHHACNAERKFLQLLIIILPDVRGSYVRPAEASTKMQSTAGGQNMVLEDAINRRIPLLTDTPTIIFGADVTHPQPGEDSSPSIASIVASMDWPAVTIYRGLVSAQQHREEIIQDCTGMISFSVRLLGGASVVLDDAEMGPVHLCNRTIYLLLLSLWYKRDTTHASLRLILPKQTGVAISFLVGTAVDTKICHPLEFDFYLCSHAGIQGTSRPAHYHVLYDENRFTADAFQTLTNNLCYTYARCTRSVSIVPPAFYAHLAAFRARYYAEGEAGYDCSNSTGTAVRKGAASVRPLPAISPAVKNVMFFC
ncbi:hypothetical protein Tsubulata_050165 [Turnera subulata]|uniref:Piwi domain-containing protein n=1 Tax=Turnera subulata TaxID=218843 RepID=A0A9Q0JGV4_9ROSI|nr:hypothetical protein Tsubulata_050165 [Turnera subulata]